MANAADTLITSLVRWRIKTIFASCVRALHHKGNDIGSSAVYFLAQTLWQTQPVPQVQ